MANTSVTLTSKLFTELAERAKADGKTTDELVEEAARRLLSVRKLRAFTEQNRRRALAQGLKASSVSRLISEFRAGRRGR